MIHSGWMRRSASQVKPMHEARGPLRYTTTRKSLVRFSSRLSITSQSETTIVVADGKCITNNTQRKSSLVEERENFQKQEHEAKTRNGMYCHDKVGKQKTFKPIASDSCVGDRTAGRRRCPHCHFDRGHSSVAVSN